MNIKIFVLELPLVVGFEFLQLFSHVFLQFEFDIAHFCQFLFVFVLQSLSFVTFLLHQEKLHFHCLLHLGFSVAKHLIIFENSLSMLKSNFLNFSFLILNSSNCFLFSHFQFFHLFLMKIFHFLGKLCQFAAIFLCFFHSDFAHFKVTESGDFSL